LKLAKISYEGDFENKNIKSKGSQLGRTLLAWIREFNRKV